MYPVPGKCPVCGDELYIERLACMQCGTVLEGSFIPQRLAHLSAEQWDFVELFLRNEGKLNRLQDELGLSYPTVRNRLHEVIRAMGYEIRDSNPQEGLVYSVLKDLAAGETTVDEVLNRLKKD